MCIVIRNKLSNQIKYINVYLPSFLPFTWNVFISSNDPMSQLWWFIFIFLPHFIFCHSKMSLPHHILSNETFFLKILLFYYQWYDGLFIWVLFFLIDNDFCLIYCIHLFSQVSLCSLIGQLSQHRERVTVWWHLNILHFWIYGNINWAFDFFSNWKNEMSSKSLCFTDSVARKVKLNNAKMQNYAIFLGSYNIQLWLRNISASFYWRWVLSIVSAIWCEPFLAKKGDKE